jgi:threonine dehydrogenase-like Zn-dependent dehydrogenase
MKAAIFYGGKDIRVEDVPTPEPGPGEVLVRVQAAGICGSDLHPYRGVPLAPTAVPRPRRDGHELAGEVARVGSGVDASLVGRRVGVEPMHLVGCGTCPSCRRGDYHICPTRGIRNGQRGYSGGFSEYDIATVENVFPLPDHVSAEVASMIDVYGCGIHAAHRIPIGPNVDVAVIGTGPVGMTTGQVARALGARKVIMVGRRDELLARAVELGAADAVVNNSKNDVGEAVAALTDGRGCAAVFETVGGEGDTMAQSVAAASHGGAIGILGLFAGTAEMPGRPSMGKELDFKWINSYSTWNGQREYQIALDMIAAGRVQAEPLVTHRFSLDRILDGFQAADDKRASGSIKVVIQP